MSERRWFEFWPELLPKEIDYPDVTLLDILETSARRFPDKTAINYYGNEITFSELLDEVENLATCLAENEISKGDRVAIYIQNSPQWVISYFGVLRANAVVVPLNPMFTEREVDYPLSDTSCEMAITTSELYDNINPVAEDLGIKIICGHHSDYLPENPDLPPPESIKIEKENISDVISWEKAVEHKDPPKISIENKDLAMIPYTAGTTGVPKGCKHTHSTVISTTVGAASWTNMTSGAVSLSSLPFFHVTGLIHSLLAPIYVGGKMVVLARWDKETAIQAIEKYRCTHWTNISTMLIDMLSVPDIEERDLDSLCLIGGGGASLSEAIGKKLEDLTGLEYAEGYGMTETISQTHMNPPPEA